MNKLKRNTALFIAASFLVTGCSKNAQSVMKELTIDNNIAYNYVVSTALSTAEGFAADLAVVPAGAKNTNDTILSASAALLVDITSGETIFQKNAHQQLYPASTTKILTGLVALENGDLDEVATLDESIIITEDNAWLCDFRVGDVVTLRQVLYGAVVNSGNDAAAAVAAIVSGSEAEFAALMNERAKELGATNSHFVNPHGLTNEAHYTTAYDLYLIFNEAVKNEAFLDMVSTVTYTTSFTRRTYTIVPTWTNGNQFINGAVTAPKGVTVIGGKTGYTQAAGNCLVILSTGTNGHYYISVILNAASKDSMYNQMTYLLEQIPQ